MPKQEKAPESAVGKREIDEHELLQLQMAEQGLQSMMMQKQAFQMELADVENALAELKRSKENDAFKIVGTLMIRSPKAELVPELEKRRDVLEIRMKSLEKQESELKERLMKTREELLKKLKA